MHIIAAVKRNDNTNKKLLTITIDLQAAMENAYNICHNVQDLLLFRGFQWEGTKQKGKGKGRKKGKKGKG